MSVKKYQRLQKIKTSKLSTEWADKDEFEIIRIKHCLVLFKSLFNDLKIESLKKLINIQ